MLQGFPTRSNDFSKMPGRRCKGRKVLYATLDGSIGYPYLRVDCRGDLLCWWLWIARDGSSERSQCATTSSSVADHASDTAARRTRHSESGRALCANRVLRPG